MLLVGTLGFVGFGALTWVILLAGVAATHSKLQEFNEDLSASNDGENFLNLADVLGLSWWMVWYHFFLLIGVAVSAALGTLRQHALLLGNFLAALFALQMVESHSAAQSVRSMEDFDHSFFDSFRSRLRAFLTGCILTAISTAALIVWLGLVVPLNHTEINTKNAAKTHDQPSEAKAVKPEVMANPMFAAPPPPPAPGGPPPPGAAFTGGSTASGGSYMSSVPPMGQPPSNHSAYGAPSPHPEGGPLPPPGATHYSSPPY